MSSHPFIASLTRTLLAVALSATGCRSVNDSSSAAIERPEGYYTEAYRPAFHFTPERNWMNDPNGMVYYDGEYHLFYQYNPFGDRWGHMSWGHAVSRDLVHWEHLPAALLEENGVMIFSGSAVVDWNNTSGFGRGGEPPLVAIYTGHYTEQPLQNQHIAYSSDRGRTWTKYPGNPVLDIGAKDFRDPKVMWHESTEKWVMTVAMPADRRVRFYGSPNLKDWTLLSDFGPAGAVKGIWECPDLFPLNVEGTDDMKWVLIVNIGGNSVAGGSGCQYFVGKFDGVRFVEDSPAPASASVQPEAVRVIAHWVDYAKDFYAAVSWSDVPRRDGRRLWIGWMSNWQYAQDVPTSPWRSAMSIPRSLTLRGFGDGYRLIQRPVDELKKLRDGRLRIDDSNSDQIEFAAQSTMELQARLEPTPDAVFELVLGNGGEEATRLRIDVPNRGLTLDRTRSGRTGFHEQFPGAYTAPLRLIDDEIHLRLFLDVSSIEIFANDGESVMTSLIFPSTQIQSLQLRTLKGALIDSDFDAWKLKSAW